MRRIAIVTYSLRIGGVETVIFNLSKSFIKNGFEVEVIETQEEGLWKFFFIENGLKVVDIIKKPFKTAISHSNQIASYLNGFDIILLNDSPYAQSKLGKLRADILVFPIMHMRLISMAQNSSASRGQWNKIIAVSPLLKEFLLYQAKDLKDEDVVCIPNGIDIQMFKPVVKNNSEKKNIIYLGRLAEEKGIMVLPEIIDKIKDNQNFGHLDIYGSGPLGKKLESRIDEFNLRSKIKMKGAVDPQSVRKIMPLYDIVLMPSLMEGHPIVLLEAMACGIVPLVTRLRGSTDIVINQGENGFLVNDGKVDEFVLFLHHLLEMDNLQEMSGKARKTIEDKYSVEMMSNSYISLFNLCRNCLTVRNGQTDYSILGDLPFLPYFMVRPVRKIMRLVGLWGKN
jgi:glycosyltransferase involved in cell wall biosynthesis